MAYENQRKIRKELNRYYEEQKVFHSQTNNYWKADQLAVKDVRKKIEKTKENKND